jgi:hypothetical protein
MRLKPGEQFLYAEFRQRTGIGSNPTDRINFSQSNITADNHE